MGQGRGRGGMTNPKVEGAGWWGTPTANPCTASGALIGKAGPTRAGFWPVIGKLVLGTPAGSTFEEATVVISWMDALRLSFLF